MVWWTQNTDWWDSRKANTAHCSPAQQVHLLQRGKHCVSEMSYFVWIRHGDTDMSHCQWQKNTIRTERWKSRSRRRRGETIGQGGILIWKGGEKDAARAKSDISPLRDKRVWSCMHWVQTEPLKSGGAKRRFSQQKQRHVKIVTLTCLKHVNTSLRSVRSRCEYREGALLMLCARHQSKWSPWLMQEQIIGSQKSGINTHCKGSE